MTDRIWYYQGSIGEQGPFSAEQMKDLGRSGDIGPATMIRKEGMSDHVPAKRVKGLLPADTTAAPAGTAPAPATTAAEAEPPSERPNTARSRRAGSGRGGTSRTRRPPTTRRRRGADGNAFSAPDSDLEEADVDVGDDGAVRILMPLAKRSGWVLFNGLIMVIFSSLICLVSLFVNPFSLLTSWIGILLGVFLIQAAGHLKRARLSRSTAEGRLAARKLMQYFLAQGLIIIIGLGLMVVAIGIGLVAGFML